MRYTTHLVTSLAVALPILEATNTTSLLTIGAVSLGALLPDIDEPNSFISRRTRGISDLLNKMLGHRGATHSLLGIGVFAVLVTPFVFFMPLPVTLALVGGYFLHILGDSFSKSGVAWFLPFKKRKYKSGFGIIYYKTGSMAETAVFFVFSALVGYMIFMYDIPLMII